MDFFIFLFFMMAMPAVLHGYGIVTANGIHGIFATSPDPVTLGYLLDDLINGDAGLLIDVQWPCMNHAAIMEQLHVGDLIHDLVNPHRTEE